jgi:catechol 2,3-dioxygenase-like lactoylglutathione lyase family enzyme
MSIDPAARIQSVHLTIADLDRSVAFYQGRLGFRVHRRGKATASLGADAEDLLVLHAAAAGTDLGSRFSGRLVGTTGASAATRRFGRSRAACSALESRTRQQRVRLVSPIRPATGS